MTEKVFFIDIDALCGKDILSKPKKVRVTQPAKNFIAKLDENNIKTVLCGWNAASMTRCKQLKNELNAADIAEAPAFALKNKSFIPLFEKFHTSAKDSFYAASNPTTFKKAETSNVAVTKVHISNPIALAKDELLTPEDKLSREEFQTLKKETFAFFGIN